MGTIRAIGADGCVDLYSMRARGCDGNDLRAFAHFDSIGKWGWLNECALDLAELFEIERAHRQVELEPMLGLRRSGRNKRWRAAV